MNKLRTLIVDDEPLARRGLSLRLENHPALELVAECNNGEEALAAVADHQPDLMFLDIQMPGMDGFGVVERLQGDAMPLVIFVTAFNEFAVDAFEVNAVDYVLKPVDEERLETAIQRALAAREQQLGALRPQQGVRRLSCQRIVQRSDCIIETVLG